MPLRDHFHPPLVKRFSWGGLHGQWPAMIVLDLNKRLPAEYVAEPRVNLGTAVEIDIGTSEHVNSAKITANRETPDDDGGGVATAIWAPPKPTLAVECDPLDQDEYEVRVFETTDWKLVAAIEIVSPANKDRQEHRSAFAAKCSTLLQQGVSVSIVDLVTNGDLLDLLGQADPSLTPDPPSLYAAACRWRPKNQSGRLETWTHVLEVGKPLPTLPLWLAPDFAVPLNLEASYEDTCRGLRIA
jgi:hypothetical protein